MAEPWRNWKHITKLDPDKKVSSQTIKTIVEATDAVMISGTLGVTREKVQLLLKQLKDYDIPKILEPANPAGIVWEGVDWVFVPSVFNTNYAPYVNGMHRLWAKADKSINWDIVVPEAYLILNPKCSAAKVSKAIPFERDDAVAAAVSAERYFKFPVIYIEYSGTYGDPALVKAVKEALKNAHLIYGGGITTKERAEEMSRYATIVVGNTVYENGAGSLVDTMRGHLLREMSEIQARLAKLKDLKRRETKAKGKSVIMKKIQDRMKRQK